MQTMFHIRLLTAERDVLAWTKVAAISKGDGCIWATQDFVAECDRDGTATALHVHWPDVHFYYTVPLQDHQAVVAGQVVSLPLKEPLVRLNSELEAVPPVTVRSAVTVGVQSASR